MGLVKLAKNIAQTLGELRICGKRVCTGWTLELGRHLRHSLTTACAC